MLANYASTGVCKALLTYIFTIYILCQGSQGKTLIYTCTVSFALITAFVKAWEWASINKAFFNRKIAEGE